METEINNKTKFDELAERLEMALGCDFKINFFNNGFEKWDDIIKKPDELVYGVLQQSGGSNVKYGGQTVTIDNVILSVMIPTKQPFFNDKLNLLYQKLVDLHNQTYMFNKREYKFVYGSGNTGSKQTINGYDYGLATFALTLIEFDSIVFSHNRKVSIDGVDLEGLTNATFAMIKQTEGEVYGLVSAVQKNDVCGVQVVLKCDITFLSGNELHLKLMKEADQHKTYKVSYNNGLVTRNKDMILIRLEENTPQGDKLSGTIEFAIGG